MLIIINILAAYRIMRLIQIDEISVPLRQWYVRFSRGKPFFIYMRPLFTCPWCLGVYVAAGTITLMAIGGLFWYVMARILALSLILGFMGYVDHKRIR